MTDTAISPTRKRKRSLLPDRVKRDIRLQIRVTAETRKRLSWLAQIRGEPLGTMLSLNARSLGDIAFALSREGEISPNQFAIGTKISIGELRGGLSTIKVEGKWMYRPVEFFWPHAREAERFLPDAFYSAFMEVQGRLRRLHEELDIGSVMERGQPKLGCSIMQALRERRFVEVDRLIKNWEQQSKSKR